MGNEEKLNQLIEEVARLRTELESTKEQKQEEPIDPPIENDPKKQEMGCFDWGIQAITVVLAVFAVIYGLISLLS